MPLSYIVEVLSNVVFKALPVGIGVEVLTDVFINVSAAVKTASKFSILAIYE